MIDIAGFLSDLPDYRKSKFLIACSAGMDSTVLAHLFHQKKLDFSLAHVNYQLRGKDSERDKEFVKNLARKYHVKFYFFTASQELKTLQKEHSLQEAARIVRYQWMKEIMHTYGYQYLVTAHNANDQAETMLLNLVRGTGMRGVAGMKMKQGQLLRPLLKISRAEIKKYATKHRVAYREDKSNSSDTYDRNYIRLHVMPLFEKRWPGFVDRMNKNSEHIQLDIQQADELLNRERKKLITTKNNHTEIDLKKILTYHSPQTMLYRLVNEFGFNSRQCESIIKSAHSSESKVFHSSTHSLYSKNQVAILEEKQHRSAHPIYTITKDTREINEPVHLRFSYPKKKSIPSRNAAEAHIDLAQVTFPLTVRLWKPGDSFVPLGMKGKKKISDLLTDLKYTATRKKQVYVVCDKDKIIWVAGIRLDERVKITPKTTNCLLIQMNS